MSTQTKMTIPMLDLNAQYAPIKEDVMTAIEDVFVSKQFIQGPKITELESAIKEYTGANSAIGVSSGTDALIVALMALGIGEGDEVITSPFTFFATAGSISRLGAVPVFVDIDRDTYNIDPSKIESKITEKTKAIMPVHLFGQMADMDPILEIAKRHKLFVIEDAAQAIGAKYTSKDGHTYSAGTMGDVGCFSFFPGKNLGCAGDGGMVIAMDETLGEKIRLLRTHGAKQRYFHDLVGGNFRLDALQAAILLVKLPGLEAQHDGRRRNAEFYTERLAGKVTTPRVHDQCQSIFNQYTLRLKNRDELDQALSEATIGHAIYYPVPLHLQNCFKDLGYKEGDLPESESAAKEVLSIPVYPELTEAQKTYILQTIESVL